MLAGMYRKLLFPIPRSHWIAFALHTKGTRAFVAVLTIIKLSLEVAPITIATLIF